MAPLPIGLETNQNNQDNQEAEAAVEQPLQDLLELRGDCYRAPTKLAVAVATQPLPSRYPAVTQPLPGRYVGR